MLGMRRCGIVASLLRLWPMAMSVFLVACNGNVESDDREGIPNQVRPLTVHEYVKQNLSEDILKERIASGDSEIDKLYLHEFDNFLVFHKVLGLGRSKPSNASRALGLEGPLTSLQVESLYAYQADRCPTNAPSASRVFKNYLWGVDASGNLVPKSFVEEPQSVSRGDSFSASHSHSVNFSGGLEVVGRKIFEYDSRWFASLAFVIYDQEALYEQLCGQTRID